MITNERQYKITTNQLESFEQAYSPALATKPGLQPRIHQRCGRVWQVKSRDLREQVRRFEALRAGEIGGIVVTSLLGLLPALIEARIAAGLTQLALAGRLGIAEQQVQRYEATMYAGVSIERIQAVADAVGLRIHEEITYDVA